MKAFWTAVLILCLASPLAAQKKAPPFWRDKHFWIGEAIMATAVILDVNSSIRAQKVCPVCVETSSLLPKHPSYGQFIAGGIGVFAFETGVNILGHHLMANDPNKYWRFAGLYAWPFTAATLETTLGTRRNYKIIHDCKQAKLACH